MRLPDLAVAVENISQASLVEKRRLAKDLLLSVDAQDLPLVVAVLAGEPLVERSLQSRNQVIRALSSASGRSVGEIRSELRRLGSLAAVARSILGARTQKALAERKATAELELSMLPKLLGPASRRLPAPALARLLSDSGPAAGIILANLLGESAPFLPRSSLADALAERFGASYRKVLSLATERGWRAATLALLGVLPAPPETFVGGSGDREERRQGRPYEGDHQSETQP